MKIIISETQFKTLILKEDNDDLQHWKRLVTRYGDEQCSFWNNRNLRHEELIQNIKNISNMILIQDFLIILVVI